MPEIINLLSSDPPTPPKPQPPKSRQPAELPSRRPSHQLNPISSDPFDTSLFDYEDVFDKPAKKRRVSDQDTSSCDKAPRQTNFELRHLRRSLGSRSPMMILTCRQ
ncbi:hypothetical protein N7453_010275 [Penicillium expansum]|nr:hypothetical protein N7453_010275 [Penicillium expansum]